MLNVYDNLDELPSQFVAVYSDGSGCCLFFERGKGGWSND